MKLGEQLLPTRRPAHPAAMLNLSYGAHNMTTIYNDSPRHHLQLRLASHSLLLALKREHPAIIKHLTNQQKGA